MNTHMIKTYENDFSKFNHMISDAEKRQAEIDELKAEFFARGGKIQSASNGEVALDFAKMPALINEFTGKLDKERAEKLISQKKKKIADPFYAGANRSKQKSIYGQNIVKTKYDKFVAVVSNHNKTFDTNEQAIEWRDRRREAIGLPPAAY